MPIVLDRCLEQALLQVLQEEGDPTFSESSDGVRPRRNAHQAVEQAQAYIREGDTWVVDIDLEQCFDRVNHDVWRSRIRRRVQDRRQVREKALQAFRAKVRAITGRTRGRTIGQIVTELRQLLLGWRAFFGFAEVRAPR